MESQDDKGRNDQQHAEAAAKGLQSGEHSARASGDRAIATDDPLIAAGPVNGAGWKSHPDETTVVETSRIRGPDEAVNPNFVMVPVESVRPAHEGAGKKDRSDSGKKSSEDREGDKEKQGQSSQPSLTRMLLYAGAVALVCGFLGAWGYSHFFGESKSGKDKEKSSSKSSESGGGSESSGGSGSEKASDSGQSSDASRKNSTRRELRDAEDAWLAAVKELHQTQDGLKAAQRSEEETKAVLDFLKNSLFSAGRPTDSSLAEAFWSGGQGKDVTLRKALDTTEAQVSEAFTDRPLGEATVREMLGQAYLTLGEATRAVRQYEQALAIREATQGANNTDTAGCRNQLAVAYRIAHKPSEGSRLFDQNPKSPAYASMLAVRGSMLLLEKKPAEAEQKLRESLKIRQKIQPDDWTTFDTMSALGEALVEEKEYIEAEPLLLSGYEGLKKRGHAIPAKEKSRITQALRRLVKLYEAQDKTDEAAKWRKELQAAEVKQP